jgi:hypothetical protein
LDPTEDNLKRALRHHDPQQLWFQLNEIVRERVYLRHGVSVREAVVLDVGANVGVAAAFFAAECRAGLVHSSSRSSRSSGCRARTWPITLPASRTTTVWAPRMVK